MSKSIQVVAFVLCAFVLCAFSSGWVSGDEGPPDRGGENLAPNPEKYLVDYPVTSHFCPPIRSTFHEVTQTVWYVNGRPIRQRRNGGYGLPVVDKVDGKNLIHVGADLGWQQVGAPVFAVAAGIVRVSDGPEFYPRGRRKKKQPMKPDAVWLPWGNVVSIEHHLGEGRYVTTVYGHLGSQRRVEVGDVVQAGQWIGDIGKQHPQINGGYQPHLHFGVRKGRAADQGMTLMEGVLNGMKTSVTIAATRADEDELVLEGEMLSQLTSITLNGTSHAIRHVDGQSIVNARLLWTYQPTGFAIVGYELSTEHWLDPIQFLRLHRADTQPAAYRR